MTETPETLAQRLRTDILWHRRRCNETIARDIEEASAALEAQAAQIAELTAARDSFHMEYRVKCDAETKAQAAQIEALTDALLAASNYIDKLGGVSQSYRQKIIVAAMAAKEP